MRIKRVEVIGFKSFCDRAVIQIDTSVTAVVGPNGCGKSNIVDAIRWCMGEQSAKHLRGKAMEDVIFNGSESRGPASMAEVSLTFDDVGFSQEKLDLARHSDEADAERAMAAIDAAGGDDAAAGGDAPDAAALAEAAAAVGLGAELAGEALAAAGGAPPEAAGEGGAPPPAGLWTDAEGNPIPSPTEEVAEMLADQPPALDFARFTEVTITRRLFRDGTSQYFINKTPCRLRDITDFFLGTGVGTKAYAIIEQGRIGQIVSSRPQDRRAIIEEAAGITKFKSKKKAAEKKLEQTRQNLLRVSDIVAELDRRMGTLRRQAQKAERYRKYKAESRDIELWKGAHRYLELTGEEQLVGGRLAAARDELAEARTGFEAKDAHVVAERAELGAEERRLVGLQESVQDVVNRIRLAESKIGFEQREARELDERVAAAQAEIGELVAQRARAVAELEERQAELALLVAEVEREAGEVAAREATAGEAKQMARNAQGRLDEARAELGRRRTELATIDAQAEALVRRRDEAGRRLERVVGELAQQQERRRELEREAARVDGALAELKQTRLDLGSQHEGFEARRELLTDEVARGEAEVETLRNEVHRRTSRLTSLKEIQERYEGFARGTRAVMQRAGEAGGDGIRGLVADVVRAPETLEVAVEAALGERLGGVLVTEPEVGVAAIGYLKQRAAGRSAFVPLRTDAGPASASDAWAAPAAGGGGDAPGEARDGATAPDARWAAPDRAGGASGAIEVEDRTALVAAHAAEGAEGVLGRMVDLVGFADGYEGVGRRLLGGCVVVDSLDRALRLQRGGAPDRLVTLEGDIVDAHGVVVGGSREAEGAGVLAQKREIRDLEEIVGGLEQDLADATARLVTARTELKQVVAALDGLRRQVHAGELAIMGHEKDASRVRADLERVRDRMQQLASEQLELDERLRAIGGEDDGLRDRRDAASTRIGDLERAQLDHLAEVTAARDRLEELAQHVTEARVRAAQLGEKRAAVEAQALRLGRSEVELATRAQRLTAEIADATRRAEGLRADCGALSEELEALRAQREAEGAELEAGRAAYEGRAAALAAVELEVRELRGRVDALTREVGQLELRGGQIAMTRRALVDGILDRHQLDVVTILHDYHLRPRVTEVEEARLAELRELIERMGTDINLTAIDEYAEVNQRFEFLSAQQQDLERAVEQLQRAIDKINKTSRKLFKDTFNAVNATFKEVFPRLFRGGQAALSLSGGEDVDLLEAGVEIMAQPPGKKNSTVDQLSGGEKALTAVALVFSIFLIKPSPFCILDEVDAPLDEANVDRYNELVREMTDRSQFIVITHNKRTMESADNLYGVTMKEPGVSMLVTVNLNKLGKSHAA